MLVDCMFMMLEILKLNLRMHCIYKVQLLYIYQSQVNVKHVPIATHMYE